MMLYCSLATTPATSSILRLRPEDVSLSQSGYRSIFVSAPHIYKDISGVECIYNCVDRELGIEMTLYDGEVRICSCLQRFYSSDEEGDYVTVTAVDLEKGKISDSNIT